MKKSPKVVFRPSTSSTPLTESKRKNTVILTDNMGNEVKITEIKKDPAMLVSERKEQKRKQYIPPDVTEMEVDDVSFQDDSGVNNEMQEDDVIVQDDSGVNNEMKVDDVSVQDDSAVDNERSHILDEY